MKVIKTNQFIKRAASLLLTTGILLGCAKELPKKEIYQVDNVFTDKLASYDINAEYLYVPMTMGTPREVRAADPFYQGKEKIVKMKFVKSGIEVYEIEKDERFSDNDLNNKPVMTIPGKYLDYKCKLNSLRECTQDQEENKDIPWSSKRYFVPDLAKIDVHEINQLDVFSVEGNGCLSKVKTELVGHTIKKGVLNIELEKTYKTNKSFACIAEHFFTDEQSGLSDASFKVRFFYSMVKLSDLASADYEPVPYPVADHDQFGFFKNLVSKLSDNFDSRRKKNSYFLNRWNPKNKTVTYHMSDSFNKPKNKIIKDATIKAVKGMNHSLKLANSGIQIKLAEPSGKKSGDLRSNVLVLIDDPLSNGLLGYAPTVTNPRTGEIVQGHINMYSGVLTSIVRHNWEGMVDFTLRQPKAKSKKRPQTPVQAEHKHSGKVMAVAHTHNEAFDAISISPKKNIKKLIHGSFKEIIEKNSSKARHAIKQRLHQKFVWTKEHEEALSLKPALEQMAIRDENRLKRFAANNALSVEAYQIAHTTKALIPGIKKLKNVFTKKGTLKRWKDLDKEQKKLATDIIIPYIYSATLVHEFGHALGLRHNFIASKDAENYWTQDEAKKLGLEQAPAYSSIMDYSFDTLNGSTVFGKYDIAALRFGYAREVEIKRTMSDDGKLPDDIKESIIVKIPKDSSMFEINKKIAVANLNGQAQVAKGEPFVEEAFAPYKFCTDGNAGLSAGCNRFDEGSTLVEITKHYIEKYDSYYKYRNFRDGRNTFLAEGITGYASARLSEFNRIRGIFEEWEFFTTIYGVDTMLQGCTPEEAQTSLGCRQVNDRRDSVKIAANFFLRVLKTPDHLCALLNVGPPMSFAGFRKLSDIYSDIKHSSDKIVTSCFDEAVKKELFDKGLIAGAEAGKFLNGFKGNNPDHIYSNDRAVRGVWVDKIVAMKALVQRTSERPLTENSHMAIIDHPEVAPLFENFMKHIIHSTNLTDPAPFKDENGSIIKIPYNIGLDYNIDALPRTSRALKNFFNMPKSGPTKLVKVLLETIVKFGLTDGEESGQRSYDAVNKYTVRKFKLGQSRDLFSLDYFLLDDTIFAATPSNESAKYMIDSFYIDTYRPAFKKELVQKVIDNRVNLPLPEGLSPEQIIAMGVTDKVLSTLLALAPKISLKEFIEKRGEEEGKIWFTAYQLGKEGIQEIINLKAKLGKVPELASEEVVFLYKMEVGVLQDYLSGELEYRLEHYKDMLPYLPETVFFR